MYNKVIFVEINQQIKIITIHIIENFQRFVNAALLHN